MIDAHKLEENLAKELQRKKLQKEKEFKEINKLYSESDELNSIKQKIKTAFLNKERSVQLAEKQLIKQKETEEEINIEANILAQRAEEEKQAHLREVENERQKQILKTHPPTHTNGRKGKG